jgi:hypothetical protein
MALALVGGALTVVVAWNDFRARLTGRTRMPVRIGSQPSRPRLS